MFLRMILLSVVRIWIVISAMLHQPHNVILLPFQIIFSKVIREIIKDSAAQEINTLLYIWMGNVFYFYQVTMNYEKDLSTLQH